MNISSSTYLALSLISIFPIALWLALLDSEIFYRSKKLILQRQKIQSLMVVTVSAIAFGYQTEILYTASHALFS
ncbi:hypothetical protein [Litorivivens sp.]|uniref:hypothetical protein n=1 Tax=Litorivivens sp. TaxID=2020868 RepID=UPI003562A6A3